VCRLEFECTNNTTEYEALIQGLNKAINMNIKFLKVFGDSEIIVEWVHNTIHCISNHLRNYQHRVWDSNDNFDDFNIFSITHTQISKVDLLANVAFKLILSKKFFAK
jgi:ribonuclease HI